MQTCQTFASKHIWVFRLFIIFLCLGIFDGIVVGRLRNVQIHTYFLWQLLTNFTALTRCTMGASDGVVQVRYNAHSMR